MSFFNWEFYVNKYEDLHYIKNKDDAIRHFIEHGKNEERIYLDIPIYFCWKEYLLKNEDLQILNINSEEKAWKHYLYYGQYENRYPSLQNKIILYRDPIKSKKIL